MNGRPNIILVHGAWAEGSCWSGVNGGQIMTALGAKAPNVVGRQAPDLTEVSK